MKKYLLLISIIVMAVAPGAYALESADLQLTANALQKTIDQFKSVSTADSEYEVVLKRDPLKPLIDDKGRIVFEAGLRSGLLVQGIIHSGEFKTALVDDRFYVAGDKVGPYEILEIRQDGFLAKGPDGEVFVPLYKDESVEELAAQTDTESPAIAGMTSQGDVIPEPTETDVTANPAENEAISE